MKGKGKIYLTGQVVGGVTRIRKSLNAAVKRVRDNNSNSSSSSSSSTSNKRRKTMEQNIKNSRGYLHNFLKRANDIETELEPLIHNLEDTINNSDDVELKTELKEELTNMKVIVTQFKWIKKQDPSKYNFIEDANVLNAIDKLTNRAENYFKTFFTNSSDNA